MHTGRDDAAAYISMPLDQFEIEGPNGTHLCCVYEVLGPKVASGIYRAGNRDRTLRSACHKVVRAVEFLHRHGICHGGKHTTSALTYQRLTGNKDITPSNILHKASGLDGRQEQDVLRILGQPDLNKVLLPSEEAHDQPGAPQYLVYPVQWYHVDGQYISPNPSLIDFGESFKQDRLPADYAIPGPYQSPEMILEDRTAGVASDLWALGCTLFEIRTGRKLFNLFDDEDDTYLDAMVEFLGPLPEPWWSTTWERRKEMWLDAPDDQGRAVRAGDETDTDRNTETDDYVVTVHPSVAQGARSLKEKLAPGVWYISDPSFVRESADERHREIDSKEIELFADLLGGLLRYRPEDRVSAKDLLEHPYFREV